MKSWILERKKRVISIICIFIFGSSIYFYNKENNTEKQTLVFSEAQPAVQASFGAKKNNAEQAGSQQQTGGKTPTVPASIIVDVKGAVVKPGIYTLPKEARVYQAIGMAGGLLPEANSRQINGAGLLKDGMLLYIPLKGESVPVPTGSAAAPGNENPPSTQGEKVDLNTATSEQLQSVPGIGPGKAAAIIQYRDEHGSFKTVDELTNVSGIGPKTVEKMKDKIFVQ
jgi:competence protein ComEA